MGYSLVTLRAGAAGETMPRYHYERLSDRSASFLANETPRCFAHAASIHVFEAGPLANAEGGVDFEAIKRRIGASLHRVPRLRQELRWIPFENHPVWVDDGDFELGYHLRHTSLPRPGGFAQLEAMAARIMAQQLDRSRPLWECWVLEGLEGGRFALLLKTHHCMIDESDADLLQVLLTAEPTARDPEAPEYCPRPAPSVRELVMDEIVQQARLPRRMFERVRKLASEREQLGRELKAQAITAAEMLGYSVRPPMDTPLNGRIGRQRRFKGVAFPLEAARGIRRSLDGMMLDVILATVTGALRSYLKQRLVSPAAVDFRVVTPVGLAAGRSGERTAEWVIDLPLWEKDAVARLQRIREATRELSESHGAVSASSLLAGDVWYGARLLSLGARALASHAPVNMTVINAPGAQVPLYFGGARMLASYGQVPLRDHHGLGVAVMSYDGQLFFGLNADFDLLPDLDVFAEALESSFEELRRAARPPFAAASI
jgi:WS/DGAT/MGAT family acyltransferase